MAVYDWIIGIGMVFGLALFLNMLTFKKMYTFFGFALIINGLVVWAGLLPAWSVILNLIIVFVLIYLSFQGV